MITGKEIKNGKVDLEYEHPFITFSVNEIRGQLDYCPSFDKDEIGGENYIGDHNILVSDLWIEEAILEVADTFSYEYNSWCDIRDQIVEIIEDKAQSEYETKVDSITGVLANEKRGGANASKI